MGVAQQQTAPGGAGDAAFGAMHARYQHSLRRFFSGYRLSHADVEDLTQDVFLRLARLPDREVVRSPDAFVFTLARNLVRDRARRLHVRAATLSVSIEETELCSDAPSPDEVIEVDERLRAALEVLGSLKPATRDAFLMHRVDGHSYSDIATITGVSVSMIEKHVMAAIHALRHADDSKQKGNPRLTTNSRERAGSLAALSRTCPSAVQTFAPA